MAVNHLPFVLLVVVTLLATTAAGSRQGGREKDSTSDKARRMRSKMERLMEKERKIGEDNRARILAEREVVDKEEEEEALSRMWQAVLRLEERCAAPSHRRPNCMDFDSASFSEQPSLLSMHTNGRLGNQMSTLATLYALVRDSGMAWRPVLQRSQADVLEEHFPKVTEQFPVIDDLYCNPCALPMERITGSALKLAADWNGGSLSRGRYLFYSGYLHTPRRYAKYLPELRRTFAFRTHVWEKAKDIVEKAKQSFLEDKTLDGAAASGLDGAVVPVGVHVRRSDMAGHLRTAGKYLATAPGYFRRAKEFFLERHRGKRVLFLVVGDEPEWVEANLLDDQRTFFVGALQEKVKWLIATDSLSGGIESSAVLDLAVLAACQGGTIVSHGTFGMWGALLASSSATPPLEESASGESSTPPKVVAPARDKDLRAKLEGVEGWAFIDEEEGRQGC